MYRTWSEEGNFMSAPDTFPEARDDVNEFGGIVVDPNNDIIYQVPQNLIWDDESYMGKVKATEQW